MEKKYRAKLSPNLSKQKDDRYVMVERVLATNTRE